MSSSIRMLIQNKILQCLETANPTVTSKIASSIILDRKSTKDYAFLVPLNTKFYDIRKEVETLKENNESSSKKIFSDINFTKNRTTEFASFHITSNDFIKEVLESNFQGVTPPELHRTKSSEKILVEFSSPNIAKPFHVGHLRSTIIGNFISNLNTFLGNDVKRLNYLGDWGTQFGFIHVGLELGTISEEELQRDPIRALYKAYVEANKLGENDPEIAEKARRIFKELESGNLENLEKWNLIRRYTTEELDRTYGRLGVTFDEYHWESTYNANKIRSLISEMKFLGLLEKDAENRLVVKVDENKAASLIKSDGSTLYLTRDIAAAIDRFENHRFDLMYYVVDNAQNLHFANLVKILRKMGKPWADRLRHVKFGRIQGMSTRKGTAIFLDDLLNEAKAIMREKQMQSPNTKVNLDTDDPSTDVLSTSAIIVNDLKQKRQTNYCFDWDNILDMRGETGIKLQYTHCRLVNLERNCGVSVARNCEPSLLTEPVVNELVALIGQFDEIILKSHEELEPYILVKYLFRISTVTNRAMESLRIKGEPVDIGSQRLLLFHTAKNVLSQGMKLIGLKPLNEM